MGGHIGAMAFCAEKGAVEFAKALKRAALYGHLEAMTWCATAGHFARGDKVFTEALIGSVYCGDYGMAGLCLAWGGDVNDHRLDMCPGIWVKLARVGG